MVNKICFNFTLFHAASEGSTAAKGGETTVVPPGKTTNNMEGEISWVFSVVHFSYKTFNPK